MDWWEKLDKLQPGTVGEIRGHIVTTGGEGGTDREEVQKV